MHDDAFPAPRSVAVTIIAVLSITAASFGVLGTLATLGLQALGGDLLGAATADAMQGYPAWYVSAMPLLTAFGGLLSLAVLFASVGLAMRRPWGRRAFLGCLPVVALLSALNIALVPFVDVAQLGAANQADGMAAITTAVLYLGAAWNLALLGLFAWYAWHLTRPAVVAEFG